MSALRKGVCDDDDNILKVGSQIKLQAGELFCLFNQSVIGLMQGNVFTEGSIPILYNLSS